jgi:hypothetical protein
MRNARIALAARFSEASSNCLACGTAIRSKVDRDGYCSFCARTETEEGRQKEAARKRRQKERRREAGV